MKSPGEYLLVVRDSGNRAVPPVACRVNVAGVGDAEFPVKDEESIGVTCERGSDVSDPRSFYSPDETAVLSLQSSFAGMAWVTVESESVNDSFLVPVPGNSGRLEIPINKEYAPNAWVGVYLLHPGGSEGLPAERFGACRINIRRPDLELKVTPVLASKQVCPKETVSGEIVVTCDDRPVGDADLTVYAVDEAVLDAGGWHEPGLRQAMYPERDWRVSTYHGLEKLVSGVDPASLHQKGFIIGAAGREYSKGADLTGGIKDLRTNFPPLAFWKTHLKTGRDGKVRFSFPAPDGLTQYRVIALAQTKKSQFGTGSDKVEISKPVQIEPSLPRFLRVGDEVELRAVVRQKTADTLPVSVRCETALKLDGGSAQTQSVRRGIPAVFRFRATVGEIASAAVRFQTDAGSGDAVEIALPVHPPTLLRKEAVFGKLNEMKIPGEWTNAAGTVDAILSESPWLPKLTGLPLLLEYPHGCFEQITSRILGYTVLRNLLDYLPEPAARQKEYRKRIEAGLARMSGNLIGIGFLPYWPGGKPSAIPTVAGYWAVRNAAACGIEVPARLAGPLEAATGAIARGDKNAPVDSYARAFALMVLSENGDAKSLSPILRELYLRREKTDEESRSLLAIAMHRLGVLPKEQQQLLLEIDRLPAEHGFDPDTFSSTTRTEAIRALAFAVVDPGGTSGKTRVELARRIDELLDSSQSLSTQENFWLLFAFKAMHSSALGAPVNFKNASPGPDAISPNKASALWSNFDIRRISEFAVRTSHNEALTCLMSAQFRSDATATDRNDRGFRVERVVKNLTDPSRTGSAESPFRLGDQVLITYRLVSPKLHHFVALEDELPAGLETVNPSIASIARTYSVPREKEARQLDLSYSELRDRETCLYFDRVEPGLGTYSVLARATCAGQFRWPATQVFPMYDVRYSGLSPSSLCCVKGE